MAEDTAVFNLRIDADGEPAKEAAAELEKYRQSIEKSQSALASYRKSLSMLKGTSAEVTDAKAKLKAAIDVEKGKVSQANLGILKLGGSYDKLTKAAKKNRGETDVGTKAFKAAGGPMRDLAEHFEGMQELLPIISSGWGAVAVAIGAGVAALALAVGAVADLTEKFTEWLATTADANRNLALQREAFSGNAKNAAAWGHVMDWASERVALTTQQLQDLVVETEKTYRGFRLSGKGMVDAFQATAMAAGAGRKDVADFFNEILQRGKLTGRTFIAFPDIARFRNAGIDVKKLYGALGITAGQAARGVMVSTDKMAAALKKLAENRFAEINGKKMLSLGSQWDRLKDNLMRFTNDLAGEGGALEPLLKAIKQVADLFDLSTQSGQDMKNAVTKYGTEIANAIVSHIPDIKAFAQSVLEVASSVIEGVGAFIKWTQSGTGLFVVKSVLAGIAVAAGLVVLALTPLVALAAIVGAAFIAVGAAILKIWEYGKKLADMGWSGIGTAIVDGIKSGLQSAWEGLKNAVHSMGTGIKKAFEDALHIGSPSKDFARYGRYSAQGYGIGLEQGQDDVESSATAVAQVAKDAAAGGSVSGGGGRAGGGPVVGTIENHFHIAAGVHAEEMRALVSSQSFLDTLETALHVILQSQGIPTTTAPAAGG